MRNLSLLFAVASMLFGAANASAFSIAVTARGPGGVSDPVTSVSSLVTSDTVTVDVFFTSTGSVAIWGISIVASNDSVLAYDGPASAALPIHPGATNGFGGATGAQPSYVFYEAGRPARYLQPVNSPYHFEFAGMPDLEGSQQIQVDYLINGNVAIDFTSDTGTDYAGTLVFTVTGPIDMETISVVFTTASNIQFSSNSVPSSDIGLSAPIVLTPEPTLGSLGFAGLISVGLLALWRRRSPAAP